MESSSPSLLPLLVGLLLAISVGFIVMMVMRRQGRIKAWRELATQLGMEFVPGRGMSPMAVQGDYQGRAAKLDTYMTGTDDDQTIYTRLIMAVSNPSGVGLQLSREGVAAKVAKKLGAQDIQTGDEELDRRLVIKGSPEEAVRQVVTSPAVREMLLVGPPAEVSLRQSELLYKVRGADRDGARLREAFELLAAVAAEVERLG